MIYTVTLNPALDKTVIIPGFRVDAVNRIAQLQVDPGGKGINVSKAVRALGGESHAYAALGGTGGEELLGLLSDCGFTVERIPALGQTRSNLKVVDPQRGTNTDINEPGCGIGPEELAAFQERLRGRLGLGDIVVMSGSVPAGTDPGIYRRLTVLCAQCGARAFVDAEGELFKEALKAGPYFVKPNVHELSGYAGRELMDLRDIRQAAEGLLEKGVGTVVVSMGERGAMMCQRGRALLAEAPNVAVASTVGAGDSMVGAFAYGLSRGWEAEKIFRLAVAAGSAAVTLSGSQAPSKELVMEIGRQVKVGSLS